MVNHRSATTTIDPQVVTIGTLNFIRFLHKHGVVSDLDGAFNTEVVVTETTFRAEGRVFLGEPDSPGQPTTVPVVDQDLGDSWKPIHEVIGPPGPAPASPESAPTARADTGPRVGSTHRRSYRTSVQRCTWMANLIASPGFWGVFGGRFKSP